MKFRLPLNCLAMLWLCIGGTWALHGQETKPSQSLRVTKKTVLEQYAPQLVVPHDERLEMKQERQALLRERRAMLDTLELSDRKKYRLLRELYERPAGEHWAHLMADVPEKEPEKKQP